MGVAHSRGSSTSGDATVDSGSRASPNSISGSIPVTADAIIRMFIVGNGGPVSNPTIANVSGNKRIRFFGTSNVNTVLIDSNTSNYELSGQWVARNGSILEVEWDGASKYTETYRNEV